MLLSDCTNIFGTDGIRNTIGTAPLTIEHLIRLGKAIACWSYEKYGANCAILLGHDTRTSCAFVKSALQTGMLLYPIEIHDAHVISTPALSQLVQKNGVFKCGIMISASHNPYQDNGIKIIDYAQGKLSLHDELRISLLFYQQTLEHNNYTTLGTTTPCVTAQEDYISSLRAYFPPLFLSGIKVVIDCAHGATYTLAPTIFQLFGAEVVTLNNQPNGTNINHECGALHVQELAHATIKHQAHIGFAFDGDGDRVIVVNQDGQTKNGDDILALLLEHELYRHSRTLVGTIMTNHGFEKYLESRDKKLIRTPVGDKHVSECLQKENLLLGGEQSGHIILRDYSDTGDGIFTALRVLQTMIFTGNWQIKTFEKYPQILLNIPVAIKKDLNTPTIAQIIHDNERKLISGRLIVRYSGTENILRVMIEDCELDHAYNIGTLLSQALQKELSVT